jgi:hypothetical protein
MCTLSIFEIAKDLNSPPGLIHPLLKENYSWVDSYLNELYNNYSLTKDNYNEFEYLGLLTERWSWVDKRLEDLSKNEECMEDSPSFKPLMIAPITWVNYKSLNEDKCLEEEYENLLKRKRSDSDLTLNSIKKIKNIYYDEEYEINSVSSLDLESVLNNSNLYFEETPENLDLELELDFDSTIALYNYTDSNSI